MAKEPYDAGTNIQMLDLNTELVTLAAECYSRIKEVKTKGTTLDKSV